MNITIEITERDLTDLIIEHINKAVVDRKVTRQDVKILVKSKRNYRAEWETAAFKATVNITTNTL